MKTYFIFMIISICIVFFIPTEALAMKRSERTKLPACLGGVCLGQIIKHSNEIPGSFFEKSVQTCKTEGVASYRYTARYKVEKRGNSPLSKNTLYVNTASNNLNKGYEVKSIYRVLQYKFSPLKPKDEQYFFVEELILRKYGRPFKVGKFHTEADYSFKRYYYDIDYKSGAVDSNIIIIVKENDREGISAHINFGSTYSNFESCMSSKIRKQKNQELLPD